MSARTAAGLTELDASVPIFVLRRSLDPLNHAGLAVQRSAGRLGIPVYGVHGHRLAPANLSRYSRGRLTLDEDAPDERWLEALRAVAERIGRAVLIPIDDAAAVFMGEHSDELGERFLFPRQPPDLDERLSSKREMHDLCLALDIPTPGTWFPTTEAETLDRVRSLGFPVVLKRVEGWLGSHDPGAPSVVIAGSDAEVVAAYRRMESPERPNVMVQEHVPGGSDSIWMFNGYFDRDSRCLMGLTGRKLRQRGPHTGPTTLGVCTPNAEVAAATERLAEAVGYRGIIDIGFRYDRRDGRYKLLDVNPRLGGSFRLFVGVEGLDVVRAQYLDLTGQTVPASTADPGRRWVVEPYDLFAAAQLANEGSLSLGGWLGSLRGVREGAWFAVDDPAPFLAMLATAAPATIRLTGARRSG